MQSLNCKHNQTRNTLANRSTYEKNGTLQTNHSSTSDLQNHKLIPNYNKCKDKPLELDFEEKVENACIMQRKLCDF